MSDSDSDVMSHFTPLDELIQVIYQASAKFVMISSAESNSWMVHVGLAGEEGRWWRGCWTEKDVREVIGAKVSSFVLDSIVDKIVDTFVKGELSLRGWSSDRNEQARLVFGAQAKTPVIMDLTELSVEDALAYATNVFAAIGLQAQSRKCQLYPSSFDIPTTAPAFAAPAPTPAKPRSYGSPGGSALGMAKGKYRDEGQQPGPGIAYKRKAQEAEEEIQALKAELERTKRQQSALMTTPSKLIPVNKSSTSTKTRAMGASLANPTKKARKVKPIEFESDEE